MQPPEVSRTKPYIPPDFTWSRWFNELLQKEPSPEFVFRVTANLGMDVARFPDISFYQGPISWTTFAAQTQAVIIRGGQGSWIDTKFRINFTEAKSHNLLRGIYWFWDDRFSPSNHFDALKRVLDELGLPEMELWVDWENTFGGSFTGLKNVIAFMELIEKEFPSIRVGLYTGYYWFVDHSNPIGNFFQYQYLKAKPLWLAWYTDDATKVRVPAPWSGMRHWQYGTPSIGHAMGVQSAEIDMNIFVDFTHTWDDLYHPLIGDPIMATYKGKATSLAKVWQSINPLGPRVYPDVKIGQDIVADSLSGEYIHLTSPVIGWSKKEWFSYSEIPTDPPPTDPPLTDPPPTTEKPDIIITEIYTAEDYEPQTVVITLKPKP